MNWMKEFQLRERKREGKGKKGITYLPTYPPTDPGKQTQKAIGIKQGKEGIIGINR